MKIVTLKSNRLEIKKNNPENIHIYVCIYVYTHVYVCVYVCMYAWSHACWAH